MDNENKWEYDYSSTNTSSGGEGGYPNVGSSGLNTANTAASYDEPAEPITQTSGGGTVPPVSVEFDEQPAGGKKPKKRRGAGKVLRSAAALVVAAAVGFAGGVAGGRLGAGSGTKVVMQTVERSASGSSAASTLSADTSTNGADLTLAQASALVSPSVVAITTEQVVYSQWSWYGQSQVQSGAGSGVIISSDGYILTCDHVVSGASNITVTIDGTDYNATVVGEDATSDIAVLKVEATGLTPASVGDSDALAVGEEVLAVGNPLGKFSGTVTNGIISGLNRNISVEGNEMTLIQTSASISPGNSGGGLFNMAGELVGIVNAKSAASQAEGLGFAIPINDAISVSRDLLENGYVSGRPFMGITYTEVNSAMKAAQLGVNSYGVYIVRIEQGGPADQAGLQAGDRIVSIGGTEISSGETLSSTLSKYTAGDTVEITVSRSGQMTTVNLTLAEKTPEATQQAAQNN